MPAQLTERASRQFPVLRGLAGTAFALLLLLAAPGGASATVTNYGDGARTGWYPQQQALTPDFVASDDFGPIFTTKVDSTVLSQPLVAKGRLVVTTVANSLYSLDPVTGAVQWRRNFGPGFDSNLAPVLCSDLKPYAGGLSTPVIDETGTGTIYTTAKVGAGGDQPYGAIVVHAVDLATGDERPGYPRVLDGSADNQRGVGFNGLYQLQRPALLLQRGGLFIALGGMCDRGTYQGWVFRLDAESGRTTGRWSAVPSGSTGGGIWQTGSGIASDSAGSVLIATGNGMRGKATPDGNPIPGKRPPAGVSQSVVRIGVTADGKLKSTDFFSPADSKQLDKVDADFASGGPVVLPPSFGTAKVPRILSIVGKAGVIYTLDRDALGGFKMGAGRSNAAVHMTPQAGGVWGKPSLFGGDGGWLYAMTFGRFDAYRRTVTASGLPSFYRCASTSVEQVGIGSSSPVITSNGSDPLTALAWAVTMPYRDGKGAQLRVYGATPGCGTELKSFRSWAIGTGAKYAPPGVGDGRIYVGTADGQVIGFGRPAPQPMTASGTNLGFAVVGQSTGSELTLTARTPLTVESVALDGDSSFAFDGQLPASRTELAEGATVKVPVRFSPTQPGMRGATLKVMTSAGELRFSLSARGRALGPYLAVSSPVLAFGSVPLGAFHYEALTFTNEGSEPLSISRIDVVDVRGRAVDRIGAVSITILPGSGRTVGFRFVPAASGSYAGEIRLRTNGNEPASVRTIVTTAFGARLGRLSISPSTRIDFGSVKVGQKVTKTVTFTNPGMLPIVLNKYKPPADGPFTVSDQLDEGSRLAGRQRTSVKVSFTPTVAGTVSRNWYVTATDNTGVRVITLKGTAVD